MKKFFYFVLILLALVLATYGIFWLFSLRTYQVEWGVSFNHTHAQWLGFDFKKMYGDILSDLRPRYVRLQATWSQVETEHGKFDFSDIDWLLDSSAAADAKVVLVMGQKAPRWPECHVPEWADSLNAEEYRQELLKYVRAIIERYKDHPALELWQVENEPFLRFKFGECESFDRDAVWEEVKEVRNLSPNKSIMITDSGELGGWRRSSKAGDILGVTLYRKVANPKGKIFDYSWFPPSFYTFRARFWGNGEEKFFISELQAEPWINDGRLADVPLVAQAETMNPDQMEKNFQYAKRTGASRVYLWGVEWWYWVKDKYGDDSLWKKAAERLGSSL